MDMGRIAFFAAPFPPLGIILPSFTTKTQVFESPHRSDRTKSQLRIKRPRPDQRKNWKYWNVVHAGCIFI
jgi:hypothetical protein